MKINFLQIGLVLYFITTISSLNAEDAKIPEIAKTGSIIENFIPKDWKFLDRVTGDLNNDKTEDAVLVLKHKSEEQDGNAPPRVLVILFKDKSSKYILNQSNSTFILKKDEGGVRGDPFESITINRGSILINHSGGSRERWSYSHRFNYRNGDFYLIGITEDLFDSATGDNSINDYNLLTGMKEEIVEKAESKPVKKTVNAGKKLLIALKDAKVMNNE